MADSDGMLLFSGYNVRAVIALCRFLAQRGRTAHIVARAGEDPVTLTDYADWVVVRRDSDRLDVEMVESCCGQVKDSVGIDEVTVLPTTEYLNRILLSNKGRLERSRIFCPLADEAGYRRLSDKQSFVELCREWGISVPPTDLQPVPGAIPLVAKPRRYDGRQTQVKPYLITNQAALTRFREREDPSQYFFQQFVDGDSFYLLFCRDHEGRVSSFSQHNLLQQADGRSIIAARGATLHKDCSITGSFLSLLEGIGFTGLVMFEVRLDREGRCWALEANPRPWGPLQLVVDAFPDLLRHYFADVVGLQLEHSSAALAGQRDWYLWLGGLVEDARAQRCPDYHGFDSERLLSRIDQLMQCEIFARPDSMKLFLAETGAL